MQRVLLIFIVLLLTIPAFGANDKEKASHVYIRSARAEAPTQLLYVYGNFCTTPLVLFESLPLPVIATPRADMLVAALPLGLGDGEYQLRVSCGTGASKNDDILVVYPDRE